MARLARRRFQPSGLWLCVLPPTASITGRKFRHNLRRSSLSHEPLALGEGEETLGRIGQNRMDSRLAKRISSSTQTIRRRSWSWTSRTDCQENGVAPRRPVADCCQSPRCRRYGYWRRQRAQNPRPERRKIVDDRVPNRFDIYSVIAMPETVPNAAYIVPRQTRAQKFRILSKPHRRFADEQKLALDRSNGLRVFPERVQIHAKHELDDHVDTVEDISQGKCGFPKRQERPHARLWRQLAL